MHTVHFPYPHHSWDDMELETDERRIGGLRRLHPTIKTMTWIGVYVWFIVFLVGGLQAMKHTLPAHVPTKLTVEQKEQRKETLKKLDDNQEQIHKEIKSITKDFQKMEKK